MPIKVPPRAAVITLLLVSALALGLPLARAQTTTQTVVSMPSGAGDGVSHAPGFAPENITVVIGVNNTVVWTNNDAVDHTVYSVNGTLPSAATGFASPIITAGQNYTYTFTVPGTYHYYCSLHSWMYGSVTVLASTKPVPEFPTAALAAILLVVVAATALAGSRLRPKPPVVP